MAGTTNALQWNPTAANQETDAQYAADSQRAGGATNPSVFEAELANKLFYQTTTYVTALFQAFAAKGFTTSDSNLSTLTAQCANFLTTADTKPLQTNVAFSSTPVFNGSAAQSIRFVLSGNVTSSTLINVPPAGTLLTFFIVSTSPGNFSFAWPSNVIDARNVKTQSDGDLFTQQFISDGSNFYAAETFLAVSNALINNAQNSANTALAQIAALNFTATKAANGSQSLPSGLIIKWMQGGALSGSQNGVVFSSSFASAFPSTCLWAHTGGFASGSDYGEMPVWSTVGWNASSVSYYYQRNADHGGMTVSPLIIAIGF